MLCVATIDFCLCLPIANHHRSFRIDLRERRADGVEHGSVRLAENSRRSTRCGRHRGEDGTGTCTFEEKESRSSLSLVCITRHDDFVALRKTGVVVGRQKEHVWSVEVGCRLEDFDVADMQIER